MLSNTVLLLLVVCFTLGSSNGQKTEKYFREDYTYIEAVESFYKIHTTPQKWTEAKRTCALEGATLWHPDNDDEAREVKSFWTNTHPTIGWVYVGLSDMMAEGVYKTVDGKLATEVYNKWDSGQPSNRNGRQDCVYLYKDYYLGDWSCDDNYNFICKKSLHSLEFPSQCNISVTDSIDRQVAKTLYLKDYHYIEKEDSYYKIHTSPKTWAKANQTCELEGATLWHPNNDGEARAVISYWDTTQPQISWVYVGLTDATTEGVFKTIDGKSVSEVYNKWESNKPNNNGDCVYMYKSGSLGDWSCSSAYYFICKKSRQSLEWYYHCNTSDSDGQMIKRPKTFFRDDYSFIAAEESFYKIHTTPKNWADAKRVCALEGATFWHPDNNDEANEVISFWKTTQPHIGWMYVGLSDIMAKGLFETVDGKSISQVYNKWQSGQPDNYGGNQHCVYIYKEGVLDDYACDYEYNFICKKTLQSLQLNDHFNVSDSEGAFRCDYKHSIAANGWFKHHAVPMVWSDARLQCTHEGATLASPTTLAIKTEMINILKDFDSKHEIYTGIHATFASGDHHTIEGIALSDISVVWSENEPDNKGNQENCITFDDHGYLADRPCGDTRPFICYRPDNPAIVVNECGTVDPEYRLDYRTKKCYKFHPEPRNFSRASLVCSAEGGHLAVINSATEAQVLTELLARYPSSSLLYDHVEVVNGWKETAVVGIYDWGEHGDWRTIHGQSLKEAGFDKWNLYKPTSLPGTFCGSLWRNGLLTDVVCDKNFAFICEKSPHHPTVCDADQQSSNNYEEVG